MGKADCCHFKWNTENIWKSWGLYVMLKAKEAEFASNLPEKSDAWRRPERLGSALMLALLIENPGELLLLWLL